MADVEQRKEVEQHMVVPGPVNSNIHYWTTLNCKPQRAGNGGPLDVTPLKKD